jgi:hypothetical protein
MSLDEIIQDKIQLIEEKTGNEVRKEVDNTIRYDALLDFDNWRDVTELPKIKYKSEIDKVHILHELIHLEKFFIEQYCVVGSPTVYIDQVRETMNIFKNIPEDYVAHKIIKDVYGFDPIDTNWFKSHNSLITPHIALAGNLVKYQTYVEFCPEFRRELENFRENVRQRRREAFEIADQSIQSLDSMDINDRTSYCSSVDELIQIFASREYELDRMYAASFSKIGDQWQLRRFNRLRE